MKNNNLQTFRHEVKNFLIKSHQQESQLSITSYQQLHELVNHLCNEKLLHPSEVKKIMSKIQPSNKSQERSLQISLSTSNQSQKLSNAVNTSENINKKVITFPMQIKEFENFISKILSILTVVEFGDENYQNLLGDLKRFKTLLKQIKGVLNVWKDKGLTNDQKYFFSRFRAQLDSIFAQGNQKILNLCQEIKTKKDLLQNISEQQIQMIKALDEWVIMQKITKKFVDFKDFQKNNLQTINSLFNKLQVKEVHFKKNQGNPKAPFDIVKVKAFNSKNDQPVDVVLVSKISINFDKINKELIKFDALKELFLSEHFPKFLGFNTHSNPSYIQYFVESMESKNLKVLMRSQNGLDLQSPLLKYWIFQIYKSFYNLFLMCSYEPELPINLEQFEVKEYGLQIILKNVNFVAKRKKFSTRIDPLQTKLLNNLGQVLLDLLKIKPEFSQIDQSLSKLEEKCLFKSLLNVIDAHQNYQKSIVNNYLSFFNLQTHPLLEESQFADGVEIIENYIAVFGDI